MAITTTWTNGRTNIITGWSLRQPLSSDLGYLETQLGFLNTNDGNRILFHTGIYEEQSTQWIGRDLIT